jgi:ATP-dependent exoDNAse (exonuclease V) beta subunit
MHARLFGADDEERDAAAGIADKLLQHPRIAEARTAEQAGRRVWREAPVTLRIDPSTSLGAGDPSTATMQIVDGQVDLAYETEHGWVVVDFKTDIEIVNAQDAYQKQVALYCEAVTRATGRPATGVLLRV